MRSKWDRLISPSETAVLVQGTTVIELVIKEDGSVENMKTVESAGNDSLDAIATEAIASPAPFGPFPDAFREKELNLRFHLGYNQPASKATPICGEFHASGHVVPGDRARRRSKFQIQSGPGIF